MISQTVEGACLEAEDLVQGFEAEAEVKEGILGVIVVVGPVKGREKSRCWFLLTILMPIWKSIIPVGGMQVSIYQVKLILIGYRWF